MIFLSVSQLKIIKNLNLKYQPFKKGFSLNIEHYSAKHFFVIILVKVQENNHFKDKFCWGSKNRRIVYKDLHLFITRFKQATQCWNTNFYSKGIFNCFYNFQVQEFRIWKRTFILTEHAICSFSVWLKALLTESHWQWWLHFSPSTKCSSCRN